MLATQRLALRVLALAAGILGLPACSQPAATTPGVLASQTGLVDYLTASDGHVYWAHSDGAITPTWSIERVDETGGAVEQVATNVAPPLGLAVDGVSVYWTSSDGSVQSAPVSGLAAGQSPAVVASSLDHPTTIAVAGGSLYVEEGLLLQNGNYIEKIPLDGTPRSTVASGLLTNLISDSTAVYFVEIARSSTLAATVWRYAMGDAAPQKVLSASAPVSEIAVGGGNLYALAYDGASPSLSDILSAPLAGRPTRTLASAVDARQLSASSESVYYSSGQGVWAMPSSGGTPTQVSKDEVTDFASEAGRIYAVQFDAQGTHVVEEAE